MWLSFLPEVIYAVTSLAIEKAVKKKVIKNQKSNEIIMVKIFEKFIYFILILLIWIKYVNVIKIFKKKIFQRWRWYYWITFSYAFFEY